MEKKEDLMGREDEMDLLWGSEVPQAPRGRRPGLGVLKPEPPPTLPLTLISDPKGHLWQSIHELEAADLTQHALHV